VDRNIAYIEKIISAKKISTLWWTKFKKEWTKKLSNCLARLPRDKH